MKRGKGALLFFTTAGMELSWRYAWTTFLATSILNQPFPFPEAIATFALAAAITLLSKGKGWRVVYIAGIQTFGFILAALRIVYTFNSWSSPFLSQAWFIEFFNTPRNPLEWLTLILVLFLTLMFWVGGVTFARRSMTYSNLCSRFDLGLAAFFLLFLAKFILLLKGGIKIEDPIYPLLIFPFFVFSLLAIGMIRNRSAGPRDFLPGYQGIGVILSFTVVILLFGTGLVLFFLPYLTLAADVGYGILKVAAKPLGSVLVSILRFMFMHGTIRPEPPSSPTKGGAEDLVTPAESSWWMEFFENILLWIFGSLMGLVLIVVSCIALFYLFRWLLSRTSVPQTRQGPWHSFLSWVYRLQVFLVSSWRRLARKAKGYKGAAQLYTALRIWGRHSGLPHLLSETPLEYGLRLKNRFPSLKKEVESIIEAFNQEVYAEIILNEQQFAIAESAWRRLRSPIHWPSRLKSWFLGPELAVF
jgi:Domain of unknown function (DUF4129)